MLPGNTFGDKQTSDWQTSDKCYSNLYKMTITNYSKWQITNYPKWKFLSLSLSLFLSLKILNVSFITSVYDLRTCSNSWVQFISLGFMWYQRCKYYLSLTWINVVFIHLKNIIICHGWAYESWQRRVWRNFIHKSYICHTSCGFWPSEARAILRSTLLSDM